MERTRSSKIEAGIRLSFVFAAQSGKDHAADELSEKMLSWSQLWFGFSGDSAPSKADSLVRERLLLWLERCIGRQARTIVTSRVEDVSLATSSPLLTAFLGRRATLELSRRVLDDL